MAQSESGFFGGLGKLAQENPQIIAQGLNALGSYMAYSQRSPDPAYHGRVAQQGLQNAGSIFLQQNRADAALKQKNVTATENLRRDTLGRGDEKQARVLAAKKYDTAETARRDAVGREEGRYEQNAPKRAADLAQTIAQTGKTNRLPIPQTAKDAAGYNRYTTGPNRGDRVFPGVVAAPKGASKAWMVKVDEYQRTYKNPDGSSITRGEAIKRVDKQYPKLKLSEQGEQWIQQAPFGGAITTGTTAAPGGARSVDTVPRATEPSVTPPPPPRPQGDPAAATGVASLFKKGGNWVWSSFTGNNLFPKMAQSENDFNSLRTKMISMEAAQISGRPNKLYMELSDVLSVKPGTAFQSDADAKLKIDRADRVTDAEIVRLKNMIKSPEKYGANRRDVRIALDKAEGIQRDIKKILADYDRVDGAEKTTPDLPEDIKNYMKERNL